MHFKATFQKVNNSLLYANMSLHIHKKTSYTTMLERQQYILTELVMEHFINWYILHIIKNSAVFMTNDLYNWKN